jgi:AraC family transcriptional regulator
MRNLFLLEAAVNYIEEHLCDPISGEDVAKACCSSLSGLQKLFRYALHRSIKEYIAKRRLTSAARDLAHLSGTVTEIAMRYQYNSPEVFARAYKRLWDVTPSMFKDTWHFSGLYPRLNYKYQEGDDLDMARKRVDISEAYEMFQHLERTCVVCFDIVGLMPINEISHEAGDKAILEAARRIDAIAEGDMLVMRIGGDEFALLTGKEDLLKAEDLMKKVLAGNGQPFLWSGKEIPLSLRAGVTRIQERHLRYSELFAQMHDAIQLSRKVQTM